MKLVKIKWWDHACWIDAGRWRTKDYSAKELTPVLVTTVGFIIKETKTYYVICSTISDDDAVKHEFCILKGTIKKMKEL